ncbi:MAG: HpcH/HpaI aldolase family protein [Rhodospirillales bacterium]|jgi:2-keto-3-deoxy-L-rhamnonate aldolase RhmA
MLSLLNPAKQRLENGELAIGVLLRQARTVDIAKIMKTCGYDYLFIDMEHNAMTLADAVQICVAALDTGIAPIVRVPTMDLNLAAKILDNGALGIIMPHVENADEARQIVDKLKYPPTGHRSIDVHMPQFNFVRHDAGDAARVLNEQTLIVATVESQKGVRNAQEIANVSGIDVVFVGGNDLMIDLGLPDQPGHTKVIEAYETVFEACKNAGVWAGMGGVYDRSLMDRYINYGARMLLAGNDLRMMMSAATDQATFLRGCLDPNAR